MVSKPVILLIIVLVSVIVLGCAGTTTPSPAPTIATTPTPTAAAGGLYTVIDYSAANPQYNTSFPIEMKTHGGNFSLYGKITISGDVPTGHAYRLMPSTYHISNSNQAVDAIGILEVESVSMSYYGTSGSSKQSGSSMVTLRSFVDPLGNYQINGLNPGEMIFMELRLFNVSGDGDKSVYINQKNGAGLVRLNLTNKVARCDIDLTDVKYEGQTSDGYFRYTTSCTIKNSDL